MKPHTFECHLFIKHGQPGYAPYAREIALEVNLDTGDVLSLDLDGIEYVENGPVLDAILELIGAETIQRMISDAVDRYEPDGCELAKAQTELKLERGDV